MELTQTEQVHLGLDLLGLLVVVAMLHLTESPMPEPEPELETLEQRVHAMLNDAMANEYDISSWTAEDIVTDLLAFADVTETAEELLPSRCSLEAVEEFTT